MSELKEKQVLIQESLDNQDSKLIHEIEIVSVSDAILLLTIDTSISWISIFSYEDNPIGNVKVFKPIVLKFCTNDKSNSQTKFQFIKLPELIGWQIFAIETYSKYTIRVVLTKFEKTK